jgi:hypothetical protein
VPGRADRRTDGRTTHILPTYRFSHAFAGMRALRNSEGGPPRAESIHTIKVSLTTALCYLHAALRIGSDGSQSPAVFRPKTQDIYITKPVLYELKIKNETPDETS